MSSNSLSLEVFSLCVVLSIVRTVYASICNASIHVACEQALYSGGNAMGGNATWIIFFESAEGASFGERSEPKKIIHVAPPE